ncbi:MAG: DGQHR domain-containing protein [Candidatus Sabulitectum sp.]|nr:DGQHR domain-containing protein [Candidatus Sabulitectum sp.]
MLEFNTSKLRTSWTRYSIVHAVELLSEGDLAQVLDGQIDRPVIQALLGTDDLARIPDYWFEVMKHKNTRSYFALIAAIFTHHEIVRDFADFYTVDPFGGHFLYNKPKTGQPLRSKVQTNVRSALIAGHAAKPSLRSSKVVEFTFRPLFNDDGIGLLFKELLCHRLSVLGFNENEIDSDFTQLCSAAGFIQAIGLSVDQFCYWISGNSVEITGFEEPPPDYILPNTPIRGLIHSREISSRRINKRFASIVSKNDKKERLQEYLDDGWILASKLKRSNKYEKEKQHDIAFEDKVWAVFAKAGFDWLNEDRTFKISYSTADGVPPKQIDVIAIDEDAAVVIECKSARKRRTRSFQKDIAEIGHLMSGVKQTLSVALSKPTRVAWVLATNNLRINDQDKARLRAAGIYHMNEDEVDYWWQITKNLEHSTKYQMYGRFFAKEQLPGEPVRVPAINGVMGGHSYYSFSVAPEVLLQIGFVLHRTDISTQAANTYQRMIKGPRVKRISRYISEEQGFFPNSVIVNLISTDENGNSCKLKFDALDSKEHDGDTQLGVLTLPNKYRSAFIIDGQHRIFGYGSLSNKFTDQIPVVAFEDLPTEDQTQIFIDINHEQKSVPRNLLRTIMSEFNWGSSSLDKAFEALKTRFVHRLNSDENSPLYKRIIVSEESKTHQRCLTLEQLLKHGVSGTLFFGNVVKRKLVQTGYFWTGDYEETLEKCFRFVTHCLNLLEHECADQWDKGSAEGGFISMNVGISAYFRLLDDLISHEVDNGYKPHDDTATGIYNRLKPYIKTFSEYVSSLEVSDIKRLRSHHGAGAVKKVLPEFQYAIHESHESYNPAGLKQWAKERTGKFNPIAKANGDDLQSRMKDYIFAALKKEFGEKFWWNEGIGKEIRKHCVNTAIDQDNIEPVHNYLNTIHYKSIIYDNSDLLLNIFTPPGKESTKKNKKLDWIVKFNNIRQKYSHVEREKVTEAECDFIEEIREWLIPRISS